MATLANGGQWFLTLGYRKYSASQASTLNLSIVLFAWGLDALLLDVRCTATQMLGLGLTLGGVILAGNSALPTRAR